MLTRIKMADAPASKLVTAMIIFLILRKHVYELLGLSLSESSYYFYYYVCLDCLRAEDYDSFIISIQIILLLTSCLFLSVGD